jgi:hypothetical protein
MAGARRGGRAVQEASDRDDDGRFCGVPRLLLAVISHEVVPS